VRILVIGGTKFVGRAFLDAAVERGHEVTLFHRGRSEPDGLARAEHLHGDRDGGLAVLRGRRWDAALDTCGYLPRLVRESAELLREAVGQYVFVSTLSVYPDEVLRGANEDTPLYRPPFPDTEEITGESYGPLKVACEEAVREVFGGRSLLIRPGYIVGPHDPTDRFTSYVRRASEGGEMLAPGPPDAAVQVVDVRDLGTFMLDRIEANDPGVYGVVGPGEPASMGDVLEASRDAAGADTTFTWVTPEFLGRFGDEVEAWLPIWDAQLGVHEFDMRRAVAAGLSHRPLAETVGDTLAWDRARGLPELRSGLPRGKERELLDAWRVSAY
jgi:nucleoside-diphosphate-sugar epimerase